MLKNYVLNQQQKLGEFGQLIYLNHPVPGLLTITSNSVVVSCLLINFMLCLVDHESSFITSDPDCFNHCIYLFLLCACFGALG